MKQKTDNIKRLYFKTDKDKIMQIMHHLNSKYLLARYKSCKINQSWEISENDRYDKEFLQETYIKTTTEIKYDGYIFNVSLKTLKDEITRRFDLGDLYYDEITGNLTIRKNK